MNVRKTPHVQFRKIKLQIRYHSLNKYETLFIFNYIAKTNQGNSITNTQLIKDNKNEKQHSQPRRKYNRWRGDPFVMIPIPFGCITGEIKHFYLFAHSTTRLKLMKRSFD